MTTPLHVIEARRRALATTIVLAAIATFGSLTGAVASILVGAATGLAIALVAVALVALALMLALLSRWRRVEQELEVVAELRGEQHRAREAQRAAMARAFGAPGQVAPRARG